MERENFYILLELSFDPAVHDQNTIKTAIAQKKQEWTRQQDNPGRRNVVLKNLSLLPEIERVMLDPALQDKEARAARQQKQAMLRQFEAELRVLEGKGHILPREAMAIALKYKAYGVDKAMVRNLAKCPIADQLTVQRTPEESGEVLDRLTAKAIQRNLDLLDKEDLYAFLEQPPYSSIPKLRDAAEQKRRAAASSGAKTPQNTVQQELAGLCLTLFEDFDSKQRYDRYLKVSQYPALGDLIDQEYNRAKYLSPAILLRLANFAVEKYGISVLEAEDHIRRYCTAYDIPVDTKGHKVSCPACAQITDRDGAVCIHCGAPLKGSCPGCGADFSDGMPICADCGFSLGGMAKALGFIDDAENALIDNSFGTAQRNIQFAQKYWPGHPKLEGLLKRAQNLEDRYARYVENIGDCVKHNQYYAALELIHEAQARRIRLPSNIVDHVEKMVRDFEKELAALHSDPNPPTFHQILELSRMVEDSIELSRMMAKHPPQSPELLRAKVNGHQVLLQWNQSESPGMIEFVLVRKQGMAPLTAFDGDVLYEGPTHSFTDKTAQPLCEYYYQVYAKRGGAYAPEGTTAGPVLIVPEVQNLRVLPVDTGAQLSWDFSPHIREVAIWRKLGGGRPTAQGEGIKLENDRLDGYTDMKLKNDVEYWYYLVASYVVDGKKVYSHGVSESVTPHKIVAPIEDLTITRADEIDEYVVNWSGSQHEDILLLASPKRPTLRSGDMVPVQELLSDYRKLDLEAKMPESARFRFAFSGSMHIFAAAVSGKFATVGASRYLANVQDVTDPHYTLLGDTLAVSMQWPQGLSEVVFAYRFDHFPKHPDESGTSVLRCSRQQYGYDTGVLIKEPEKGKYYAKIFSQFTAPDGTRTYSRGVELLIDNTPLLEVFYKFRYQKRFLASSGTVSITVSAPMSFTLPQAVFVGKIGRMPLRPTEGMPLFEVEKDVKVDGTVTYQYRTNMLPKDLYVRMFLQDDTLYDRYRLLPQSAIKIT